MYLLDLFLGANAFRSRTGGLVALALVVAGVWLVADAQHLGWSRATAEVTAVEHGYVEGPSGAAPIRLPHGDLDRVTLRIARASGVGLETFAPTNLGLQVGSKATIAIDPKNASNVQIVHLGASTWGAVAVLIGACGLLGSAYAGHRRGRSFDADG